MQHARSKHYLGETCATKTDLSVTWGFKHYLWKLLFNMARSKQYMRKYCTTWIAVSITWRKYCTTPLDLSITWRKYCTWQDLILPGGHAVQHGYILPGNLSDIQDIMRNMAKLKRYFGVLHHQGFGVLHQLCPLQLRITVRWAFSS